MEDILGQRIAGGTYGDADAGRRDIFFSSEQKGPLQSLLDPIRNPYRITDVVNVFEQDCELIAPYTGDRIIPFKWPPHFVLVVPCHKIGASQTSREPLSDFDD